MFFEQASCHQEMGSSCRNSENKRLTRKSKDSLENNDAHSKNMVLAQKILGWLGKKSLYSYCIGLVERKTIDLVLNHVLK